MLNVMFLFLAEVMFVATPFTSPHSFTGEIEGPACDREGNVYAVSFERKPTIGRVTPEGKGEIFLEMPPGSLGNGIRFDSAGMMYVADHTGHNILRVDPEDSKARSLCARAPHESAE